jgi:nucleoid DNA-binding protein
MFELLNQNSRKARKPQTEARIKINIAAKLKMVSTNQSCGNAIAFAPFLSLR